MNRAELVSFLAARITELALPNPARVAIDGIDTAGKTTLANELGIYLNANGFNVIRASIDGFHQPRQIRYSLGEQSPEGYFLNSFDLNSLIDNLLAPLGPSGNREYCTAVFDFEKDQRIDCNIKKASQMDILLFDGIFLQKEELKPFWDYIIFVDIRFESGLKRALSRDLRLFGDENGVREHYLKRYYPAQEIYFSTCFPKESANIVVDNNDPENPEIFMEKE